VVRAPFYEFQNQIAVDFPGARAVFTTVAWGDVRKTDREIGRRLGVAVARPRQVHGSMVIQTEIPPCGVMTEADAVATSTRNIAATVISADCVPVVISGGGAVAAVHAGWKGLRDGVIGDGVAAVRRMSAAVAELPLALAADAGSEAARNELALTAAIGPCAGACCYEVSDELHEVFAERGQDSRNGQNLDLNEIARLQLQEAGVQTIHDLALCTICSDPELLFSHRRDHGETGRQGALVWLT
jgi:copper oxidase (laccase) domain-containing protein